MRYLHRALEQAITIRDQYHHMLALLDIGRVHGAQANWNAAETVITKWQRLTAMLAHAEGNAVAVVVLLECNNAWFAAQHNVPDAKRLRQLR